MSGKLVSVDFGVKGSTRTENEKTQTWVKISHDPRDFSEDGESIFTVSIGDTGRSFPHTSEHFTSREDAETRYRLLGAGLAG